MKLYDLFFKLEPDTLVAISDIDKLTESKEPVQYQKLQDIKWGTLYPYFIYDVMQIIVNKDNNGLLIHIGDATDFRRSVDHWDLVDKYFKRKEQRIQQGLIT